MPPFCGERAFAEVVALVQISPRDAGTPQGEKAAIHLVERLQSFGIQTERDTFRDQTPEGEKTFHNVIGKLPGKTDRWIILASHFDTMPGIENFQGANDSGSSTGVLLELARMLAGRKPQIGLLFVFFDGEEGIRGYIPGDGLHGSRYMAEKMRQNGELEKIEAFILMDMVGDKDLHFTIPYNSSRELVKELYAAARDCGYRDRFSNYNYIIIDDHSPFLALNVPAINIIDFNYGSSPGKNDYWHTPHDNLDNISAESLEITGTVVLRLLTRLIPND
jgi:glutaminyl-peptide cyclotransferase